MYAANELADFVVAARKHYDIAAPIALGYSNGANIAAAILLLRSRVLAGAILLRATLPLSHPAPTDLTGVPVLINSGAHDPMMSPQGSESLARKLQQDGAVVELRTLPTGHELSQTDVSLAKQWLRTVVSSPDQRSGRSVP